MKMERAVYSDDWLTVYSGDCRAVLPSMPADSVDCVVTSPPYWGLRDYGHEGQLGLERTPEEYVANMVAVFAEVRRVLKPSGTCWLNLGDSYASNPTGTKPRKFGPQFDGRDMSGIYTSGVMDRTKGSGLQGKQLIGIPWRVAFALQADGWYLRSEVIWQKPNPMPESVTDRPTKSHEQVFLLTKSPTYYFDQEAVRESAQQDGLVPVLRAAEAADDGSPSAGLDGRAAYRGEHRGGVSELQQQPRQPGRNLRSVWTIPTRPYSGAHFAVFPPELPERCIKAGSSERGVCPECGAPWERVVETTRWTTREPRRVTAAGLNPNIGQSHQRHNMNGQTSGTEVTTTGWHPTCAHFCKLDDRGGCIDERACYHKPLTSESVDTDPQPALILDPFAGSGTTGMVAQRLGRRAILIDLNPDYLSQQMKRNAQTPLGLSA